MGPEIVLVVLLIILILVIFYYHFFGLRKVNRTNIRTGNESKQKKRSDDKTETKTDLVSTRKRIVTDLRTSSSLTNQLQTRTEQAKMKTDVTPGGEETATDESGDSDAGKENSQSAYTDTASDEYNDSKSNWCGEDIDPDDEQSIFRSCVDEKSLNEHMERDGILRGLMKFIKENIVEWKNRKLNIAIIGNSRTGKSSLINALRGLKPGDEKAAPVGVTETTKQKEKYEFPENENVVLWDLPGVGTQQFKKDEYLEKLDISGFDAFIIVSATRFTENEIWLAETILKQKNFMFFVRTKIDMDLMNEKRDHPKHFDTNRCLQAIRSEIRKILDSANIPMLKAGIFLVSSVEKDCHDFQELFEKLRNLLNLKGFAIKNLLDKYVTETVRKDGDAMKGKFILQKGVSAVSPLIIVANIFASTIVSKVTMNMYQTCKREFCLDDESIQDLSSEINISVADLKKHYLLFFKKFKHVQKYFSFDIQPLDLMLLPRRVAYLREVGLSFPGYQHFKTRLDDVCDTLAVDEATLVKLRLIRLEEQLRPL